MWGNVATPALANKATLDHPFRHQKNCPPTPEPESGATLSHKVFV